MDFCTHNVRLSRKHLLDVIYGYVNTTLCYFLTKVTNLKIQSNPFARGFRGDWRKTKAKRNSKKGGGGEGGLSTSNNSTSYEDCAGGEDGEEEDENYAHHGGGTIMNSEDDENEEQHEQSTSTSFDDKENESMLAHPRFGGTVTIKVEPDY